VISDVNMLRPIVVLEFFGQFDCHLTVSKNDLQIVETVEHMYTKCSAHLREVRQDGAF